VKSITRSRSISTSHFPQNSCSRSSIMCNLVSEEETLRLLAPHMQQAAKLHFQFSELKARSLGIEAAFDMLKTGGIFLGSNREVIHMSRAASRTVSENDGLIVTTGELRAKRPTESAILEKMIRDAVATTAGKGLEPGGTVLLSRRSRPPLQIQISPIRSSMPFMSESIAAVVIITDPAQYQRPGSDMLRAM
jgi:hypothetical protein